MCLILNLSNKSKTFFQYLTLLMCLNSIMCQYMNDINGNGVIEIIAEEIETNDIGGDDLETEFTSSFVDYEAVAHKDPSFVYRGPPPHNEVARMARYVTHNSDWAAMATISTRNPIQGFPFSNVFSLSDGPVGNSTGIPYMYLTTWEMSVKDLMVDNRASLTMSLAQGQYCNQNDLDPEDPRCAHIILTGHVLRVENNTAEAEFAKNALFSRHPIMPDWPVGHEWFFGKLNITNILVLDFFGGAADVPLEEYFAATPY